MQKKNSKWKQKGKKKKQKLQDIAMHWTAENEAKPCDDLREKARVCNSLLITVAKWNDILKNLLLHCFQSATDSVLYFVVWQ